jgi:hypothetical protein
MSEGVGVPTPIDLRFLLNEVLLAGHAIRLIDPGEVFGSMTCSEATLLSNIFAAAGDTETAEYIIFSHGTRDDDPEDEHHQTYLDARKEAEAWK